MTINAQKRTAVVIEKGKRYAIFRLDKRIPYKSWDGARRRCTFVIVTCFPDDRWHASPSDGKQGICMTDDIAVGHTLEAAIRQIARYEP